MSPLPDFLLFGCVSLNKSFSEILSLPAKDRCEKCYRGLARKWDSFWKGHQFKDSITGLLPSLAKMSEVGH